MLDLFLYFLNNDGFKITINLFLLNSSNKLHNKLSLRLREASQMEKIRASFHLDPVLNYIMCNFMTTNVKEK